MKSDNRRKLLEFYSNPETTTALNRMGCSENWYNPYYAITQTFSVSEIGIMADEEIDNLVRLAQNISDYLY